MNERQMRAEHGPRIGTIRIHHDGAMSLELSSVLLKKGVTLGAIWDTLSSLSNIVSIKET